MDNSQNIFGRTFYGWSNFLSYPWISKSITYIRRKNQISRNSVYEVAIFDTSYWEKMKKNSKYFRFSWKLWRHNLIWFDMFFWRKNACILLTVRHFSEIRSLCLMKSSCKKNPSNFLTNEFSDLRPSREKHKTMWVIIPIPKIWVWLGHFIKHKPPILEQYF